LGEIKRTMKEKAEAVWVAGKRKDRK
jgi:hypothetical protein